MKMRQRARVLFLLLTLLAGMAGVEWITVAGSIPDHIQLAADGPGGKIFQEALPKWIQEQTVEVSGQEGSNIPGDNLRMTPSSYTVTCSAFGVIPVKEVQVDVVERQQAVPGGMPVGIYMKTEGVLIVGTGEVCDVNGTMQEPVGDIVHSGDYILSVNGIPVSEKEEVVEQINQAAGDKVTLSVLRRGEKTELLVPVVQTGADEYKAGIWIRDDTQGIGTLTYRKEDGSFGALGHGISDIDTSTLLELKEGSLYQTDIRAVVKGENGMPGELSGIIRYEDARRLGTITENTGIGIFGTMERSWPEAQDGEAVDIAYKQEIREGAAKIRSAVSGEMREYDIEIERVRMNSSDANKSMVIRVTDPELLEQTGGIVQGMSGSPILQDGRLVGAVTHVFVNDPTKGYGIFIETMLER